MRRHLDLPARVGADVIVAAELAVVVGIGGVEPLDGLNTLASVLSVASHTTDAYIHMYMHSKLLAAFCGAS